jgi:hypothetical protein
MSRKIIFAALAAVLVMFGSACSGSEASEGEPSDGPTILAGSWEMTQPEDAEFNMTAVVKDDNIAITFHTDGMSSLYWKGSFPKTAEDDEDIVSKADVKALESSLMGSQDKTKTFTFEDGKLKYTMGMMGAEFIIELEKR